MTIASDIRGALKTALENAGIAATIYAAAPEAPIPPGVAIIPDTPWLVPNLINKSTIKVEINLILSCVVAYNSNAGALDNLEQLVMDVLTNIPSGYVVNSIDKPAQMQVGPSTMLVSDISVSTYYAEGA